MQHSHGRHDEEKSGQNTQRQTGPTGTLFAFDTAPRYDPRDQEEGYFTDDKPHSDFERGGFCIHNTTCHAAPTTAVCGWRDPYGGDVRESLKYLDPENATKALYPYGKISTGSLDGMVAVWALCCGERLAAWPAHRGAVTGLASMANGDTISCGLDGTVKVRSVGQQRAAACVWS